MKGMVFAAGLGTRLRPVTDRLHKALVPVVNCPAICHALAHLKEAGLSEVICNLHHLPDQICTFFKENDNFGFNCEFSFEPEILGTGGGLMQCRPFLDGDDFILINSDIIADFDFPSIVRNHRESGLPATLVLVRARPPAKGEVGMDGGSIVDFRNFRKTGLSSPYVYAGAAVLSPEIFSYLSEDFSSVVYTAYIELAQQGRLGWHEHDGYWHDIGTAENYLKTNLALMEIFPQVQSRMKGLLDIDLEILHPGAEVASDSEVLRSFVGEGAVIGSGCHIQDSVVLPGSHIPPESRIERGIAFGGSVIRTASSGEVQ